jgi:mitochondrial fission protein ELM1
MCHREGDNAQMLALGEALNWPFQVKRVAYRWTEFVPNMLCDATLIGINKRRSSPLTAPWPDLVILAGRRNENVAKWIRRQSGGHTRLVLIGRPWSSHADFDLIVTTPQLRQPLLPNVLHNSLPLHLVTKDRLAEEANRSAARFGSLPRPYVAVLVGGSIGAYVFDHEAADRLGRAASAMATAMGGSLLVTTSPRTPRRVINTLAKAVSCPNALYRWRPDDPENPYLGYLALATALIVTGDSASMLAEACATGKPVFMFDFGGGAAAMRPETLEHSIETGESCRRAGGRLHLKTSIYTVIMRMPHWRINRTRDLRLVHRVLLASDRARWLGEPAPTTAAPPLDDLARAVDRVRVLCGTARREVASSETAATIAPLALVGDALPVWRVEDGRETA